MNALLQNKILAATPRIEEWLRSHERDVQLFMSADIRDAGFKVASIDANLYPAGFNNLHEDFHPLAVENLKAGLLHYGIRAGSRVLIISEEHTRNLFYLENIHVLKSLIERAGYTADVATAFELEGELYKDNAAHLQTARGNVVSLMSPIEAEKRLGEYAALVMNHDSSAGTPAWIQNAAIPVLPAWQAGWHTRSKARHFAHYKLLMKELGGIVGVDPWFFSPLDAHITGVDINADSARGDIGAKAEILLKEIQAKYDEYQIQEKPFVFLKSDHGTYGMAMLSFDTAAEIMDINRKEKNKLFKGKSSVVVKDYLLQEGVPTIVKDGQRLDALPGSAGSGASMPPSAYFAESVVMLANNRFIGKFLRVNEQKDARTSLNSTGMFFKPLSLAECQNDETTVATLITRVAGIALQREVCELVTPNEPCFSDRPA